MLPNKYNFHLTEKNQKTSYWKKIVKQIPNQFTSTLLLPPPNITGNLHLGHALNSITQDFLVRFAYLNQKPVYWIAGMDHAGISTQSKIEGLKIAELDTDQKKSEYTFQIWYPQNRKVFYQQWEKLGLLIDYEKANFTLDPAVQKQVREAFVKLYQDRLIYRGVRLVNWDPRLKSVISDIEVEHKPGKSKLYYLKYPLLNPWEEWMEHAKECCGDNEEKKFDYISPSGEKRGKVIYCQKYYELRRKFGQEKERIWKELQEEKKLCPGCGRNLNPGGEPDCFSFYCSCGRHDGKRERAYWKEHYYNYLVVATSRPETIFADVALFVNPTDQRYQKYHGWQVKHPGTGKIIPLLTDKSIKIDFGTGVLKVTPGHDFTDYELGKKYQLPLISCCDERGVLNELAGRWQGQEISSIREELVAELEKKGVCLAVKDYETNLAYSTKSGALIEPLLSQQWFLDLPALIKKTEQKQPNFLTQIKFEPNKFQKVLESWRDRTQQWCISRQLWWGHRIPAWHHKKTGEIQVGENPPKDIENWEPEKDVLDTWFSSSLWPLVALAKEGEKFPCPSPNCYPITTLITGYDILFFWVLKMILLGTYFTGQVPFQQVLLHGLIRDQHGKKMSKSLGNGVEPEVLIEKYGCDSLRLFLLENNIWGSDLIYNEEKVMGSWRFCQKVWSIANLITSKIPATELRKISKEDLRWNELRLK